MPIKTFLFILLDLGLFYLIARVVYGSKEKTWKGLRTLFQFHPLAFSTDHFFDSVRTTLKMVFVLCFMIVIVFVQGRLFY